MYYYADTYFVYWHLSKVSLQKPKDFSWSISFDSLLGSLILSSPLFTLDGIYVTGFVKNDPNHTKSKIHFIAEHLTFTLRSTKHMAIDGQVCFHIQPFAIPIKPPRCTTGSLGPVNHINKDVSGARLLPTTVLTYPVDWVYFCHWLKTQQCSLHSNGRYNLPLVTHHPPYPFLPAEPL